MRSTPTALKAHMAQVVSTLTWLVKVTRTDGIVLGFTTHDRDLDVGGLHYEASTAIGPSTIESQASTAPNNLSLDGILSSDRITEADLMAGRYDGARMDVFRCNWMSPADGVYQAGRYFIGQVNWSENKFSASLLSLKDALGRVNATYLTERCRYAFGSPECGINVEAIKVSSTVAAASGYGVRLVAPITDRFAYGILEAAAGPLKGLRREIKSVASDGTMTLWEPFPTTPATGTAFFAFPGCDKQIATCGDIYDNTVRFGGFPHVPGADQIMQVPDVKY